MSNLGRRWQVLVPAQEGPTCSAERRGSAHPPADTRPRVVPSSQPVPGPLGGFEVMTISTLILFSPLVPDALPFLLLFKSKATSRPRQDPSLLSSAS